MSPFLIEGLLNDKDLCPYYCRGNLVALKAALQTLRQAEEENFSFTGPGRCFGYSYQTLGEEINVCTLSGPGPYWPW